MSATRPFERSWQERRSTTLKDIADAVGVSESTVSVVLNQTRSGARVSQATRQAVIEVAEKLGYRPNVHARSLQTGRAGRVGFYSGRTRLDARNLFFAELMGGMLEGSEEVNTNTVIHTTGSSRAALLDFVSNRAVDGIVVHLDQFDPMLAVLDELRVPAVAIADSFLSLPSIVVDDAGGGVMQAHHLADLGHRYVLVKQASIPPASAAERVDAFVRTAKKRGVHVDVRLGDAYPRDFLSDEDKQMVMRTRNPVTAIVGWNDQVAEGVCRALLSLGIRIPEDVAVLGFDGFTSSFAYKFELTTIRAPWVEVGRTAVRTLNRLIRGETVPSVTVLPVEFVRGKTT